MAVLIFVALKFLHIFYVGIMFNLYFQGDVAATRVLDQTTQLSFTQKGV